MIRNINGFILMDQLYSSLYPRQSHLYLENTEFLDVCSMVH